ncbi:MAG: multicopper oxidase domain-containing protein [Acidobacteria bacterium]|nr:multicopper oxidase domain-containing protein [Acidobacteriota bacterium]
MKFVLFSACILAAVWAVPAQNVVRYELTIDETTVNYSGKSVKALAINGQIPAPTLTFTEGDIAEIHVKNNLKEESSLHWHGILLPNEQDGVPYLTTTPIAPGGTHNFRFPIKQSGTYWYHSHSNLQEQRGLYGPFIIKKRDEPAMPNYTVLLSDWTDESPHEVHRSLKNANDWYAIKKDAVQSYGEAANAGALKAKFRQEWQRMNAMDVSDVYYNAFLTNGKKEDASPDFKAGDKVRLRIINGSASTYFWVQFAGSQLSVVASDGMDVVPINVDRMMIAVAETMDVIVTIPENKSFELRSTAEDRTKATSLWLGSGEKVAAPVLPKLKLFEGMKMMNDMGKHKMKMSYQQMDMNDVMYPETVPDPANPDAEPRVTLNYGMLKSPTKTAFDPKQPVRELKFRLTGNMNRYMWSMDDKPLSKSDKILIKKGEVVRITLYNDTMMRHPMHLHGHFFRVLNGQGEYSPLKNVLDIMPMEEDVIEFDANEEKDWFFHCHILYHMMSGMGRVFSYENSPPNTQVAPTKQNWNFFKKEDERMVHTMFNVAAQSNGIFGHAMVMNNYYFGATKFHFNPKHGFESENRLGRFIDKAQFLNIYAGFEFNREENHAMHRWENEVFGTLGFEYTLPMFVKADARVTTQGKFRLQLSREDIPLSKRLRIDAMWNTDKEYEVGFRYILTKRLQLTGNYYNHYGLGAGLTYNY